MKADIGLPRKLSTEQKSHQHDLIWHLAHDGNISQKDDNGRGSVGTMEYQGELIMVIHNDGLTAAALLDHDQAFALRLAINRYLEET
ncbi:MAG: hypothetical protein ACREBW_10730 [Candidatus Micrarchaeaceae archaeon]